MLGQHLDFAQVRENASANKSRIYGKAPGSAGKSGAERARLEFPDVSHRPKFRISPQDRFFTIGSCFARNIEAELHWRNLTVLNRVVSFPGELYETKGVGANNGALNAYSPASMQSLVHYADRADRDTVAAVKLSEEKDEWADMLVSGLRPLSGSELADVRSKLSAVYGELPSADVVVVTLGYTESWFDKKDGLFINRSPGGSRGLMRHSDRFQFYNADAPSVRESLADIVEEITRQTDGRAKIVITVSPVPLFATWTERDCITANMYSKCTLLTEAVYASQRFENVDYYPSYEMVTLSDRPSSWEEDGQHVKPHVVKQVIAKFLDLYMD